MQSSCQCSRVTERYNREKRAHLLTGKRWIPRCLAALAAMAVLGGITINDSTTRATNPIANWLDDVIEDLEDAEESLDDAALVIGGSEGPLSEPDRTVVAMALDNVMEILDRILDPLEYPSLDPPDAGTVYAAVDPDRLPDYAVECATLIKDAIDELCSAVVDEKIVGSDLRTIEHLISREYPHNYRTLAGIE